MEKLPAASGHNITSSDNIQTWNLRVYVHCEGCKRKIFKLLQSIDGVYKTVIDSKQHKATVTGSTNGDTLVQKLLKSGKHAEILTADNVSGKKNDAITTADDVDEESESDQKIAEPAASGGGGKKKKNNNNSAKGDPTEGLLAASMEHSNLGPPGHQVAPYDLPPYQNYYPTPAYGGMSYSASYPSVESSYHTPPVYGYAQSYPSVNYYRPPPPPTYYCRSAFDDHDDDDDEGGEGRRCTFM
ncbi:putative heavy metal-associated domain, HMA, heavy metal-associated domain superfamily [Helianthus debilis subsp. tardiflorus]